MNEFQEYQHVLSARAKYPREQGLEYLTLRLSEASGRMSRFVADALAGGPVLEDRQGDCLRVLLETITLLAQEIGFDLPELVERSLRRLA